MVSLDDTESVVEGSEASALHDESINRQDGLAGRGLRSVNDNSPCGSEQGTCFFGKDQTLRKLAEDSKSKTKVNVCRTRISINR